MADNIERGSDGLPLTSEKELAAIEKLLSSEKYQIKEPSGFLRGGKKGLVNPDFVMYTLDEFLRRIYVFATAVKRMIPSAAGESFFATLKRQNPVAEGIIKTALALNLKTLNATLNRLQASARSVSIAAMQPFVRELYKPLIRVYYLTPEYSSSCLMQAYQLVMERHVPSNPESLRSATMAAVQELKYIYDTIFPTMYPLMLRMTSPIMLSEHDLFYKNGSKVLAWLEVRPEEILFPAKESPEPSSAFENNEQDAEEELPQIPESVAKGLDMLEQLFPKAGWEKIREFPEEKTDFAPYFARIFQLSDAFIQLNPEHPLHFAMILFLILSELFQGLRHVDFNATYSEDNIYAILDDWIMYNATVFDKTFGDTLKAYTHQVYSQPDFEKSAYASRLISNMYSLIRQYFLPFLDMRFYPLQKTLIDRLPPLYPRVTRLREMLEACIQTEKAGSADFTEAVNASAIYHFDIPSSVSKRIDALYGGSSSRKRTNAVLIDWCVSLLSVLDWWINDKDSPAYKAYPDLIYRTAEGESLMPEFGIAPRTDTDEIFKNSLKRTPPPENAKIAPE